MAEMTVVAEEIERLAVHCRPPIMDQQQRAMWLRDWCADLREFPNEAVSSACRKWRHGGSAKFPTPGQLLEFVRSSLPADTSGRGQNEAWRPLSDEEYAALSVREKIRHHQILAADAGRQAGPMFLNTAAGNLMSMPKGRHLTAEEMPERWREWKAKERGHLAEVQRLRGYIRSPSLPSPSITSDQRQSVADQYRALAVEEPTPAAELSDTHGKTDERGLTPELRAIIARQQEA